MEPTKRHILDLLLEPYSALSAEEVAAVEAMAREDAEVASALRECRALSMLDPKLIIPGPVSGDVEFLTALRTRIDQTAALPARGIFAGFRMFSLASAVCTILIAVIIGHGTWYGQRALPGRLAESLSEEAWQPSAVLELDSLAAVTESPESLAAYLGIEDMAGNWEFDKSSDDEPLTDALLNLDQQSLQEVLTRLEATNFF